MKIIFTRPDGGVSIMTPAPQAHVARVLPQVADMTEQQYVEFIRDRDVPIGATNVSVVADNAIPVDRTFRNALKADLTHDKAKAVEITKDRLRAERAPLLADLDAQYIRALEEGKPTAAIVAEKNRLRNITIIPNASMTLDELKAIKA